jgi:hypothetical protein
MGREMVMLTVIAGTAYIRPEAGRGEGLNPGVATFGGQEPR